LEKAPIPQEILMLITLSQDNHVEFFRNMTRHDIIITDTILFMRLQSVAVRLNVRLYRTCIHYFVVVNVDVSSEKHPIGI